MYRLIQSSTPFGTLLSLIEGEKTDDGRILWDEQPVEATARTKDALKEKLHLMLQALEEQD